ncbi:hypothetical protein [Streptomyces sp. NPDC059080]|uniref:hypothetical protein n=1 Tax=Streptomyces sp. NPDC059080 TaxID=3346718 RepID=UPI0036D104C0
MPELGESVTDTHDETAEQQADITRLLLHHIQAPISGTQCLRGVLPAPDSAAAIRIVTGAAGAYEPTELIGYEFPLDASGDQVTARDVLGMLRTLLTGTHIYPNHQLGSVMGMTLVQVDPTSVNVAADTSDERAFGFLRALVYPYTEEEPEPRLRGFLLRGQDQLRLYVDLDDASHVIAVDIRTSGATTALLAALPSLLTEELRTSIDEADPHCSRAVDLTDW